MPLPHQLCTSHCSAITPLLPWESDFCQSQALSRTSIRVSLTLYMQRMNPPRQLLCSRLQHQVVGHPLRAGKPPKRIMCWCVGGGCLSCEGHCSCGGYKYADLQFVLPCKAQLRRTGRLQISGTLWNLVAVTQPCRTVHLVGGSSSRAVCTELIRCCSFAVAVVGDFSQGSLNTVVGVILLTLRERLHLTAEQPVHDVRILKPCTGC